MCIRAVLIAIATSGLMAAQQRPGDNELARLLANESSRRSAIDQIVADGGREAALLLSWTLNPPTAVDKHELDVGLADAFGRLRTGEAVPFLINNIRIQRWAWDFQSWLREPQEIESAFPAVAALIRIGPAASKALAGYWLQSVPTDSRLPIIFVMSRIAQESPDAKDERAFLSSVLGEANIERAWAEEGLK